MISIQNWIKSAYVTIDIALLSFVWRVSPSVKEGKPPGSLVSQINYINIMIHMQCISVKNIISESLAIYVSTRHNIRNCVCLKNARKCLFLGRWTTYRGKRAVWVVRKDIKSDPLALLFNTEHHCGYRVVISFQEKPPIFGFAKNCRREMTAAFKVS